MNDQEQDDEFDGGSSVPAFVLPFVTAAAALGVGALLGGLVIWLAKPAEIQEVKVPRDLTQAELEEVCAPFVIEKDSEVQVVQAQMVTLAKDLKAKNERVAELEAKLGTTSGSGGGRSAIVAELEKAKRELTEVKAELEQVREERDQLVEDLKETIVQLEKAEEQVEIEREQKELYKADALINKWKNFKAESKLDICDRGGRKKLGRCRETVAEMMTDATWGEFKHCVLAGQAVPTVIEIEKGKPLPQYARYIDQENRVTKDWALLLCDPTLPEQDLEHEDQAVTDKAPI